MRLGQVTACVAVLLAAAAQASPQQAPYLVKDINTVRGPAIGVPAEFLSPADDLLYFFGEDDTHGRELWRTAGTSATTGMVADLTIGPFGGTDGMTTVGNVAFFTHADRAAGGELWRSDGTVAGTNRVRDINPGPAASEIVSLTTAGGLVYFTADDGSGRALWRSDGTATGTFLLRAGDAVTLLPGAGPLFFVASSPANGLELWTSDGTVAGTTIVKDACPGTCSGSPELLTRAGSLAYFTAEDGTHGRELWRTDGTSANTAMVGELTPGTNGTLFEDIEAVGPLGYVATQSQLFRVNPAGTPQLLLGGRRVTDLAASGSRLFFLTASFQLQQLWRSDGTVGGTIPVADLCTNFCIGDPGEIVASSQYAFYLSSDGGPLQLTSNDGTPGSSVDLTTASLLRNFTIWNDRLYFTRLEPGSPDFELWSSDGTIVGTGPVYDVTDSSSTPLRPIVADDRLFFYAYRPDMGYEPWVTEGSEATTVGLDVLAGPDTYSSNTSGAFGRDLLFTVDGGPGITTAQLWRSDGTLAGTGWVKDVIAADFASQGSLVVFRGGTDDADIELWRTDGTTGGTVLVKDLLPSGPSFPRPLASFGGQRFLSAYSATAGKLWRTDGTAGGTIEVADLYATESVALDTALILAAAGPTGGGSELWRTDGTAQGTVLVKDISPSSGSQPRFLTRVGDLVFFVADSPAGAFRLWKTDGSEAGTTMVPGVSGQLFAPMAERAGVLYFLVSDAATGAELWRSDGTGPGTHIVKDIAPGPEWAIIVEAGSTPLVSAGGQVWFAAYTVAHGLELWRSDGTAEGTVEHADIAPGPRSSWPIRLVTDGSNLYFVANDWTHGRELWAVDLAPAVSVADVAITEGDAPGRTAALTLSLSTSAPTALTVAFQTADGTALAGVDYVAQSGTVTFPSGVQTGTVIVPLVSDQIDEPDETFAIRLTPGTAAVGDAEAVVLIQDDDEPRVLVQGASVNEGNSGTTPAAFQVELTTKDGGQTSLPKTVAFASEPLTAVSPSDFAALAGELTFAAGTPSGTAQVVSIGVVGDTLDEPDERFVVRIVPTSDLGVASAQAYGLILDDDGIDSLPPAEVAHGSVLRATLAPPPGRSSDRDWYVARQESYASYELVVDETSSDAVPLVVERMAADGTAVLQAATAEGTGGSVALRWQNSSSQPITNQPFRITGACDTDCGADDTYRLRLYETTLRAARFNNGGGQATFLILQNRSASTVSGSVFLWQPNGTVLFPAADFSIGPRGTFVYNVAAAFPGWSGSLTVAHDAPYGMLAGKTVALEPSTGFSFDTPLTPRPR